MLRKNCLTNKFTTTNVDTDFHIVIENHAVISELKHTDGDYKLMLYIPCVCVCVCVCAAGRDRLTTYIYRIL